jgi:hypothetical protein
MSLSEFQGRIHAFHYFAKQPVIRPEKARMTKADIDRVSRFKRRLAAERERQRQGNAT